MKNTNNALNGVIGYSGAGEIIDNFAFSGDWEMDHIKLSNKLQDYYYHTVGVYNEGIESAINETVNAVITEKHPNRQFVVDHNQRLWEEDQQNN